MDENKVEVSIIIPCYNKGKYIMETLDSVTNQTIDSWECIVVDDGSTDSETIKILKTVNHPKIKVYFETNQGVSNARNTAIKYAIGDFILPLDADDKIAPDYAELAVNILKTRPNVKIVSCLVELFGKANGIMSLPDFSLPLLLARNTMVVSCFFRRKDFLDTPGYRSNMKYTFEDWDLWLSLLKNGGQVHQIKKPLFYYRIISNSRNYIVTHDEFRYLRKTIYENHKDLYSEHFLDPVESFEYQQILDSREYRFGKMVVKSLKKLRSLWNSR